MMYRAVIFDLDGTLLDTLGDLAAACNAALRKLGMPPHEKAAYRFMVGDGIPKLIERMLPEDRRDIQTLRHANEYFFNSYNAHMTDTTAPYPGIVDLLEKLKQSGVRIGILSNKADAAVRPIVARCLPDMFDAVLGLREGFAAKPDPASALYLAERIGARPDEVLYCGDSGVDMQTAAAAGMTGCGVLWGFRGRDELMAAGARFLIENTEELERLILGG